MGAPTIFSGLLTEQPVCITKTAAGNVIVTNGLQRPQMWDGLNATSWNAGVDPPTNISTTSGASGGNATAGIYTLAYRNIDKYGNPSVLSPLQTLTVSANQKFSWAFSNAGSNTDGRIVGRQLFRSLVGVPGTLYLVTQINDTSSTTYNDTLSDVTLGANAPLIITNNDARMTPNANRFVVPPSHKAITFNFQNLLFYLVDVPYTTGTVSTSGSSTTVTGASTNFNAAFAGRYLYPAGSTTGYLIDSVSSGTSITLHAAANLASGTTYVIRPGPTERNRIYYSASREPESVPQAYNYFDLSENTGCEDELVGGFPYGSFAYLVETRHIYSLQFSTTPFDDGNVSLVANRGAFNNRCWALAEGIAYLMDQSGMYAFDGGSADPIGADLNNYFREGLVDFSKTGLFFVRAYMPETTIRFYVVLVADGSTSPKTAFCFNYRLKRWWIETYPWQLGGAGTINVSGQDRYFAGGQSDIIFWQNGFHDGDATLVAGTVSAATSNTLTDANAAFTDTQLESPVTIYSGTGKGQRGLITAHTDTQLTISPNWTITPDTTSKYMIGGIPWTYQTGLFDYPITGENVERGAVVSFVPSAQFGSFGDAATFDVRRYINNESSPLTSPVDQADLGDGGTIAQGSADFVVPMIDPRSDGNPCTGIAKYKFGSHEAPGVMTDHWMALELRGVQGPEQVIINTIVILGVG